MQIASAYDHKVPSHLSRRPFGLKTYSPSEIFQFGVYIVTRTNNFEHTTSCLASRCLTGRNSGRSAVKRNFIINDISSKNKSPPLPAHINKVEVARGLNVELFSRPQRSFCSGATFPSAHVRDDLVFHQLCSQFY